MLYIVTDPCYILPREQWEKCCEVFKKGLNAQEESDAFDEAVAKALTEYTGSQSYASATGAGDWDNTLYGRNVVSSNFYADAGMVCVCRLTPKIEKHLVEEYGDKKPFSGMAIFTASEDITVKMDTTDPQWTVVRITDNQTGETLCTMEPGELDEDEDYYDEEYY